MIRALTKLIIGAIIISCLITPPIFSILVHYFPDFGYPYSRVFNRVILLVFIVVAFFLRKELSLKELVPFFSGGRFRTNLGTLLIGVTLALIGSSLGLLLLVNFGELEWSLPTISEFLWKLFRASLTGITVGFLEESIFRVLLFVGLIARFKLVGAAAISSLLYAVAHFVSPDKNFIYTGYSLSIGFEYLQAVIARLFLPGVLWGIIGLFIVGLILCYSIHKTRSIYLAVGLHCGWIIAVKISDLLTDVLNKDLILPGTGTRFLLVSQPIGWLSVLLVCSMVFLLLKYKKV